jgi:thiamine transport system substrate-binding protein
MKKLTTLLFSSLCILLASCAPSKSEPQALTVMTHSSFAVSEAVVKAFEEHNNVKVTFIQSGDAGEALNKAILTKDAPLADVLFGVDNTFLSRAIEAKIFEPYQSPLLENISDQFKLDDTFNALPVDFGDVCINYDKKYFSDHSLETPQSLEDLKRPEYKDLLVVENPATSSTGLAFLLATRAHFGDQYLDYWKSLKANGVAVVDDWETAYYTNFSGSSGHGAQPMVVSYGTSPAAEVIFAETPPISAPTASIVELDTCFRQIEFVGILKGTHNRALAEKFVDFMLDKQFQEDMPLQMFVYPVNKNAEIPEAFIKYAQTPDEPAVISAAEISANRDGWIESWVEAMK